MSTFPLSRWETTPHERGSPRFRPGDPEQMFGGDAKHPR